MTGSATSIRTPRLPTGICMKRSESGKPVSVPTTTLLGCQITLNPESKVEEEITSENQVSRIIQHRFQKCHCPDSIGPFALMDYDDVCNFSEMIWEVVPPRRMPPWHADPRYGKFLTDRSLTKQ